MSRHLPIVLVIAGSNENWTALCSCYSDEFEVGQGKWEDITLTSYSDSGCIVELHSDSSLSFEPSLVVVRHLVRSIGSLGRLPDFRPILFGFVHAGIPLVNNLRGILAEQDRPLMYGGLVAIQRRLGADAFPLIPQTYYPSFDMMVISPNVPFVLKIGWPHAGYGKIRIRENGDFADIRSVVAVNNNHSVAEPFIQADYEIRIDFIAPDFYRVHQRRSMGWKVNMGFTNIREDMEMTPLYKTWCNEVRGAFGGLDIFAIDGIVAKEGRQYILEVNGSTCGLPPEHIDDYMVHMRELVRTRLMEALEREAEPVQGAALDDAGTTITNLRNRAKDIEEEYGQYRRDAERAIALLKSGPARPKLSRREMGMLIAALILLVGLIIGLIRWK
jgi:hypothetical protein